MAITQIKAAALTADLIDETKLADNSIDSEHYNDGSIDNAHLADDAVGVAELSATGTASSSTFLRGDNSWATPTDTNTVTTINNNADNKVITGSGTANTLEGEANLTYDGNNFEVIDSSSQSRFKAGVSGSDTAVYVGNGSTNCHCDLFLGAHETEPVNVNFGDAADPDVGQIKYDNGSNYMSFTTGASERLRIASDGKVGIGTTSLNARLTLGTGHYTDANSGQAVNGLHAKGTAGNAGEYGGAISFATGGAGASAIAARQGGSDSDQNGLSFFTHGSTNSADVSVEKVRIHHGGVTSFNDGICLGNSLTLSAANTMDDYEEGTWTPHIDGWDTYTPHSGSTYNYNWYVKIGQLVHVGWKLYIQNLTTVSSDAHIRITGLPFAHQTYAAGAVGHIRFDIPEFGMSGYPIIYLGGGGTILYMYKHVNGGNNLVAMNAAANRSNLWCMGTATYATS